MTDLYDQADDYREDDDNDPEPAEPEWDSIDSAKYWEHRDEVHGGEECDCRPSLAERAAWRARDAARWVRGTGCRLTLATRHPVTVRIGPAEITVRLRADRGCGACSGRGWFWTMTPKPAHPMPPGYNGAALCGCGAAIGKLAETRRHLRRAESLPPF